MPSRYTQSKYNFPTLLDISGSVLTIIIAIAILYALACLTL